MASLLRSTLTLLVVLVSYVLLTVFVTLTLSPPWFSKMLYQSRPTTLLFNNKTDNGTDEKALLTLFTTALDKPWKRIIHNNTFQNWAALQPKVTPLFFYDSNDWLHNTSLYYGWASLKVPKTNKKGTPIVRTMFLEAQKHFDSHFYAYANADILFDETLIRTLEAVINAKPTSTQILITGRRTNVPIGQTVTSLTEISQLLKGKPLFGTNAQDYFISSKHGYDWETIPDFVVGRVGYDNWLVVHAILSRMAVVDATGTLGALHQTGKGGNTEGWSVSKDELYHNYAQAGKFDYSMGHTTCSEYKTVYDVHKNVFIQHRAPEETACSTLLKANKLKYDNVAFKT